MSPTTLRNGLLISSIAQNTNYSYVIRYVDSYVANYGTVIRVLGSGTNDGSSPQSGCGCPPSLVPTHPHRTRGVVACRSSLGEFILCRYNGRTVL